MVSARKKHRIKKVYSTQKVYTFLGFPKSRVGNDAEHICGLDHPYHGDPLWGILKIIETPHATRAKK